MAEQISIPNEFYVGVQKRAETHDGELVQYLMSFMTPNGTDAAAKKRISSVNDWVNRYGPGKVSEEPARIVPNVLQSGYEMSKCVYRNYWGGGNVVWQIKHPEGFEFQISSNNLGKILECTTIVNGVIQGNCIMGRSGSQNILLPENSEPYIKAIETTKVKSSGTVSIKDIPAGAILKLKNEETVEYLGSYQVIFMKSAKTPGYSYNATGESTFEASPKKIYFFQRIVDINGNKYTEIHAVADMKVHEVLLQPTQTRDYYNQIVNLNHIYTSFAHKNIVGVVKDGVKKFLPDLLLEESPTSNLKRKIQKTPSGVYYMPDWFHNKLYAHQIKFDGGKVTISSSRTDLKFNVATDPTIGVYLVAEDGSRYELKVF